VNAQQREQYAEVEALLVGHVACGFDESLQQMCQGEIEWPRRLGRVAARRAAKNGVVPPVRLVRCFDDCA
jgi:hypothetical protein|tara:strand:+ start:2164 stop:2373 length:210 start_codon:yes stop_codon:yes gene_type:complete